MLLKSAGNGDPAIGVSFPLDAAVNPYTSDFPVVPIMLDTYTQAEGPVVVVASGSGCACAKAAEHTPALRQARTNLQIISGTPDNAWSASRSNGRFNRIELSSLYLKAGALRRTTPVMRDELKMMSLENEPRKNSNH
jgi:hypothetical protein